MSRYFARSDLENRKKLSGGMLALAFLLLAILAVIFGYSLHMAATTRVHVIWIDSYVNVSVEGADGYGMAMEHIDRDGFREELTGVLRDSGAGLEEEEIQKLSQETADSLYPDWTYSMADRGTGPENSGIQSAENRAVTGEGQEGSQLPAPGLSNGDFVTLQVRVSEEMQEKLRERGMHIAFECDPVTQTAEGLPAAEPYDAFADLNVTFSGYNGLGQASLAYGGSFPFIFTADPGEALHNGDQIRVRISFAGEYENDLDRIVEDFHIMPVALEQEYTVAGLWVNPTSISDFTRENTEELLQKAADMAGTLIEEEYTESEQIDSLDPVSLYFAVPSETQGEAGILPEEEMNPDAFSEEQSGPNASSGQQGGANMPAGQQGPAHVSNYFYCIFLVNYMNDFGDEKEYYYYVCYQDLKLDDQGNMIGDFSQAMHPDRPQSMVQEILGSQVVSLPGWRNMFRTVTGYESEEELISQVIDPLEAEYTVTAIHLQ